MYFSGRAAVTAGEMREEEKRGPCVEWDMLSLPVVAAGDCHMIADRKYLGYGESVWAKA